MQSFFGILFYIYIFLQFTTKLTAYAVVMKLQSYWTSASHGFVAFRNANVAATSIIQPTQMLLCLEKYIYLNNFRLLSFLSKSYELANFKKIYVNSYHMFAFILRLNI